MRASAFGALLFLASSLSAQHWGIGDGSLSLAKVIERANATCTDVDTPCTISFYFHPELLQQQLSLNEALPVITACNLTILAPPRPSNFFPRQSWAILGAASNRAGFIVSPQCDGSKFVLDGLWLSGFAHDAIVVVGSRAVKVDVVRSYIYGGSRGIAVHAPAADVSIADTTITNTNRSGITLWSAAHALIDGVLLRNSGASGLFVGPEPNGDVTIHGSEISGHRDFGVALARTNVTIAIETTVILNNTAGDIDWGLDGPDRNEPADRVPDTPRIVSARYDAARNVTRIEVDPASDLASRLEVWASPRLTMFGQAHLQSFVTATFTEGTNVTVLEHPGDLRGLYVSALRKEDAPGDRVRGRVSEVSFGVRVE
jgi:hypothetical protein